MHDYLRAIGFSRLPDRKSLQYILELVMADPDREYYVGDRDRPVYWEKSKDFLLDTGLTVRGDSDAEGRLTYEYFFPYCSGAHVSFTGKVDLEKQFERDEYNGICEVPDLGVVMVFHMNRLKDYAARIREFGFPEKAEVRLSALSIHGTVLLPLARKKLSNQDKERLAVSRQRYEVLESGDLDALEALAKRELELFHTIVNRIQSGEDVLSVVESSFMPFGTANDQYSILGDIVACKEQKNMLSGEMVWKLTVLCNGKLIDVCINAEDLKGEPKPGRRFRGTIWLQGQISK